MDFTESIREWVSADNKIKKYQEEIKKERNIRAALTTSILDKAEESHMEHAVIEITDGKLKFQNTRVTSPLTFKFLEDCLNECIGSEDQVKQIVKYIKSKRQVKFIPDIKRTYTQRT
uniref:Uncharacterized protein n=1 Tax=viral metagenome TaxID=1070528 RepID=A0A6C0C5R5_9ZZZZ